MHGESDCRALDDERHVSLCETLDRILNKGVAIAGEVVISVADIDLIYLNLQLMLSSVETAQRKPWIQSVSLAATREVEG